MKIFLKRVIILFVTLCLSNLAAYSYNYDNQISCDERIICANSICLNSNASDAKGKDNFIYFKVGNASKNISKLIKNSQFIVSDSRVYTRKGLALLREGDSDYMNDDPWVGNGEYIENSFNYDYFDKSFQESEDIARFGISFVSGNKEALRIHADDQHISIGTRAKANYCVMTIDGAVSIGPSDTNPEDFKDTYASDYLLWVEKGIVADDIVLAKPNDWDDEVFNKDYKLRSLKAVESFINENKHLPEVPSEIEVLEKGYRIHEMNRLFMRKIEELTLYSIEQEKAIDSLKARLGELEKMEANRAALE